MKTLFLSLAFILLPASANAGQILPDLYAKKFCELRYFGVSAKDARAMAIEYSYVSDRESRKIKVGNDIFDSDVYSASIEVVKLCPTLLN